MRLLHVVACRLCLLFKVSVFDYRLTYMNGHIFSIIVGTLGFRQVSDMRRSKDKSDGVSHVRYVQGSDEYVEEAPAVVQ